MHPNYHNPTINNDVALLKLSRPAQLNSKVGLICLPNQGDRIPAGRNCWMTGKYDVHTDKMLSCSMTSNSL